MTPTVRTNGYGRTRRKQREGWKPTMDTRHAVGQFRPQDDANRNRTMKDRDMQTNQLAETLAGVYPSLYAAKDGGKSGRGPTLVVDDRGDGDIGPDGRFEGPFTQLLAKPWSENVTDVCMRGLVPLSVEVHDWVKANDASLVTVGGSALQFRVSRDSVDKLRELAEAVDNIAAPGREAPFAALTDVCPRTAASLRRLADNLDNAWRGGADASSQQNGGGRQPPRAAQGAFNDGGSGQDSRGQRHDSSGRPQSPGNGQPRDTRSQA
jgi:hypothetical protein